MDFFASIQIHFWNPRTPSAFSEGVWILLAAILGGLHATLFGRLTLPESCECDPLTLDDLDGKASLLVCGSYILFFKRSLSCAVIEDEQKQVPQTANRGCS